MNPDPYSPLLDDKDQVVEEVDDFARRMAVALPRFPRELVVEWLHWHGGCTGMYRFLFDRLTFTREQWKAEQIPGREAFLDPGFCDAFSSTFDQRVENEHDWLPRFMNEHGTWNTPIVLLENTAPPRSLVVRDTELRRPWHLLEGHRRLSFFVALRNRGQAHASHLVWVARFAEV